MNRFHLPFLSKKMSSSFHLINLRTTWTVPLIPKVNFKQAAIPSVYIHEEMDTAMDLDSFKELKREIFEVTQPR
jgi:hypothetical protein